ncbi:MAG: Sir2 family NAD-dependent protein deacetylase [Acidobacteriota bacterium]
MFVRRIECCPIFWDTSIRTALLYASAKTSGGSIKNPLLESGIEVPFCKQCGGWIKIATVSFGQSLPSDALEEAFDLAMNTDLILALGSSLVVEPAAFIPRHAKNNSARLVIINNTETLPDGIADIVVRQPIGETMSQVLKHSDGKIKA